MAYDWIGDYSPEEVHAVARQVAERELGPELYDYVFWIDGLPSIPMLQVRVGVRGSVVAVALDLNKMANDQVTGEELLASVWHMDEMANRQDLRAVLRRLLEVFIQEYRTQNEGCR